MVRSNLKYSFVFLSYSLLFEISSKHITTDELMTDLSNSKKHPFSTLLFFHD